MRGQGKTGLVGPIGVVAASPPLDVKLRVPQREKPMLIQALVAEPAIEAFDVGVLNRFPGLNEEQLDLVIGRPRIECTTPELTAIIEREPDRFSSTCDDRFEGIAPLSRVSDAQLVLASLSSAPGRKDIALTM